MHTDNEWEARYQAGTTGWDRGQASPGLFYWLDQGVLVSPARVLIPGCGNGYEVDELARRGFEVVALDIAPTPVNNLRQRLRQQHLRATVEQADLFEWQADVPFDAVYEQTCLCAIDPAQRAAYADQLYQWLRPGGVLLAQFMQTGQDGGPPFHCALEEMATLFPASRWQLPERQGPVVDMGEGRRELGHALVRR